MEVDQMQDEHLETDESESTQNETLSTSNASSSLDQSTEDPDEMNFNIAQQLFTELTYLKAVVSATYRLTSEYC